jgi:FkbM family methyltransferase
MLISQRVVRSVKELFGMKQWPRKCPAAPLKNQDEFFLSHLIRPGDLVFDIGANQGDLARFMARLCGEKGKVVSFEPVWRSYERSCAILQEESILRAPIIPVPAGISDRTEVIEIHLPDGHDALASIAPVDQIGKAHHPTSIRTLKCGVITLDLFVETTGMPPPQLVKIDVEGAEFKALAGGKKVFEHPQQPILFMEIFGPWLRKFGHTTWDVLGYLQSVGYAHLFMCSEGLMEHRSTQGHPFPKEFRMGYNVISYVPAKHAWVRPKLEPFLAANKPKLPPMDPPPFPNE